MATPHLLRTFTLYGVHTSPRLGPSRPLPGGLAHLQVMKTNNANSRAPEPPSAWPIAIAPLLMLTLSREAPVSACHANTTDANASLTRTRRCR
jgi:hypothetical protein